jgi:hypothetical protein
MKLRLLNCPVCNQEYPYSELTRYKNIHKFKNLTLFTCPEKHTIRQCKLYKILDITHKLCQKCPDRFCCWTEK